MCSTRYLDTLSYLILNKHDTETSDKDKCGSLPISLYRSTSGPGNQVSVCYDELVLLWPLVNIIPWGCWVHKLGSAINLASIFGLEDAIKCEADRRAKRIGRGILSCDRKGVIIRAVNLQIHL